MCGGLAPASHDVGMVKAGVRPRRRAVPPPAALRATASPASRPRTHRRTRRRGSRSRTACAGARPWRRRRTRRARRRAAGPAPPSGARRACCRRGRRARPRRRHAEQRADEAHEVAALVAPQIADRRPGAQIEEEVVGVHDHVHDRALDRGGRHDQHDERGDQRGRKQHPARQQDQEGDQRQRHGRGEKNVGKLAFVDPEIAHQDRGDQRGDSPGRRRTKLDASQQLRCTGAQPGSSRPSCRKAKRLIRHGPTVEPRHKSFTDAARRG